MYCYFTDLVFRWAMQGGLKILSIRLDSVDLQSLLSVCCLFVLDQKSPCKVWKVNIHFNFVVVHLSLGRILHLTFHLHKLWRVQSWLMILSGKVAFIRITVLSSHGKLFRFLIPSFIPKIQSSSRTMVNRPIFNFSIIYGVSNLQL